MKKVRSYYPWTGMFIVSMLMCLGFLIIYFTGINNIDDFYLLKNYFFDNGTIFIFCVFFILVGLYCWFLFIRNVFIKPKKRVLYLYDIKYNTYYFFDSKGKKYNYFDDKLEISQNIEVDKYYDVLKTYDHILEIYNLSSDPFELMSKKESYWLNFYSPVGNFENIFLLPIVYVILLPFLLSFIFSNGFDKIYGIIGMVFPLYIIIYDLIYKLKKNKDK